MSKAMEETLWTTQNVLEVDHHKTKIQKTLLEIERQEKSQMPEVLAYKLPHKAFIHAIYWTPQKILETMLALQGWQKETLLASVASTFWRQTNIQTMAITKN